MPLVTFSVRRSAAIAIAALASACTSLLGIDGNYAIEHSAPQGAAGSQSTGGASSRGVSGTTGFDADSGDGGEGPGGSGGARAPDAGGGGQAGGAPGVGGAPAGGSNAGGSPGSGGSGGVASGGSGGAASGSGGAEPDAAAPLCPTGTFRGTYTGTHHPISGGTAIPATIGGDITLHLAAGTPGQLTVMGTLADPLDDATGGVQSNLSGTIDCTTATGSATLLKGGQVTTFIPTTVLAPIDGTLTLSIDDVTSVSGTFTIHESLIPAATGSGKWSATRSGN